MEKKAHLDFSTLYGAALILDPSLLGRNKLTLTKLLNLSQLIESIVLQEKLQYERGSTPDWDEYLHVLDKSIIREFETDKSFPLSAYHNSTDDNETTVGEAVNWAAKQIQKIPEDILIWSIKNRRETYKQVSKVKDKNNIFTQKYISTAVEQSKKYRTNIKDALTYLKNVNVDIRALHELIRVKLLSLHFEQSKNIDYLPHFSRQPLLGNKSPIKLWSVDLLRDKMVEDRNSIDSYSKPDNFLSPIFVACLYNAKRPEDIITNALDIRNNDFAKKYRDESDKIMRKLVQCESESSEYNKYKLELLNHIKNLNDILLPKISKQRIRGINIAASFTSLSFKWNYFANKVKTKHLPNQTSFTFLTNVYEQALHIVDTEKKIEKIFNSTIDYNIKRIYSCEPNKNSKNRA